MKRIFALALFAPFGFAMASAQGPNVDVDYAIVGRAAVLSDDGRDLGFTDLKNSQQAYLDLTPWTHFQAGPSWSGFLRGRAFLTTGSVIPGLGENAGSTSSNSFAGLKELWIAYGGLTSYPGEIIRFGRQHVRQSDAEWFDQDIDALRWVFDTTLISADIGVAEEFASYRSDNQPLPSEQYRRPYFFGNFSWEWLPQNRIGVRVVDIHDYAHLPDEGMQTDSSTKLRDASAHWIGLRAENGYYEPYQSSSLRSIRMPLYYWAEVSWLGGTQESVPVDSSHLAGPLVHQNLEAVSATAGLRWPVPVSLPLQLGVMYAYAQGGVGGNTSHQFFQTGIQSNYSRFTGTESFMQRYNDALRIELSNVEIATIFASLNFDGNDASLVYQHFRRPVGSAPVVTDGINVAPVNGSGDLGNGYDLVASHYFSRRPEGSRIVGYSTSDDYNLALRLRGSVFEPGAAYGVGTRDRYRVSVEVAAWF